MGHPFLPVPLQHQELFLFKLDESLRAISTKIVWNFDEIFGEFSDGKYLGLFNLPFIIRIFI